MMGSTISLAGKPRRKPARIVPSSPMRCASGSKNPVKMERRLLSAISMLAAIHMRIPAGAAAIKARPRTNSVRSRRECTRILPILGFRYGGSSRTKEEGIPFNIVLDRKKEVRSVIPTPRSMNKVKIKAVVREERIGEREEHALPPIKKKEISKRSVGKRPLHGTNAFVKIAIRRSLGESMIRQPTTPAALQPNPIHSVRHCFPQA